MLLTLLCYIAIKPLAYLLTYLLTTSTSNRLLTITVYSELYIVFCLKFILSFFFFSGSVRKIKPTM